MCAIRRVNEIKCLAKRLACTLVACIHHHLLLACLLDRRDLRPNPTLFQVSSRDRFALLTSSGASRPIESPTELSQPVFASKSVSLCTMGIVPAPLLLLLRSIYRASNKCDQSNRLIATCALIEDNECMHPICGLHQSQCVNV